MNEEVCMKLCLIMILTFLPASPALLAQESPDSASISGSAQVDDMRNLLIERVQYKEGTLFRNDFVRDYSPFDVLSSHAAESSFMNELRYRESNLQHRIGLSTSHQSLSATFFPLLEGASYGEENGMPQWKQSYGLAVAGSLGQDFVFYAKAVDSRIQGGILEIDGGFSSQPAYDLHAGSPTLYNYYDTEFQLGARFGFVQVFVEKIRNTWGYGRGGQLVLSPRAPSYPQLRGSIQLLHNLKFTVLAGFLDGHLLDPTRYYTDENYYMYSNFRQADHSKYIFAHVLEYSPIEQLNFAAGEEMIVGDRFAPEYILLPIAFYHNLYMQSGGLDQTNIWGGARYTYRGLGTAYATLFIDDFNTSQDFYDVGGTVGATLVDIGHRNLDATVEFTAITPFVYSNNNTLLYRTTDGYPLGDWLGQNAERAQVWLDYRPLPQVWISATYVTMRKGLPGKLIDQYGRGADRSLVEFLKGPMFKRNEFSLRTRWEMYSGLFADVTYRLATQTDQVLNRYPSFRNRSFISFALKLNVFDRDDEL